MACVAGLSAHGELDRAINKLIDDRLKDPKQDDYHDIIALLLRARIKVDEGVNDVSSELVLPPSGSAERPLARDEIVDQITTFIIGGFDTSGQPQPLFRGCGS